MPALPNIVTTDDGNEISYHHFSPSPKTESNHTLPTVIFMGGLKSDMQGSKAVFLESWCKKKDIPYIRFDYLGHGESSGSFTDGTIGRWKQDALTIIDRVAPLDTPLILIGSSLGGWISLLCAIERPEKVCALIGIAPAPDFTEELVWDTMTDDQKELMLTNGQFAMPSDYCDDTPYPLTLTLIEEGRNHLLLANNEEIPIKCPIRLIHGMQDQDVPYTVSQRISKQIASNDVIITLQKNGDHRMSSPDSLALITANLEGVLTALQATTTTR